jgi:hypothetical protein
MAKYFPLPDGNSIKVPDSMTYQEASALAQQDFPELFNEKPKAKKGLMADLAGSAQNLINIGRTGIGALTGNTTAAAEAGAERAKTLGEKYESGFQPQNIADKWNQGEYLGAAGEALSQIPSAVASIAPSVGQEMGLAATGRIAGGALGSLAGPGGTLIGQQVGQYALPLAVNFVQALGSQAQEKIAAQKAAGEKPDVDAMQLAPYAAGNAALNLVGTKIAMPSIFKKAIGQKVAGEAADETRKALVANALKVANRGTWNTIGRGVGGFAFGELPTEVLQDVLDRAAVGKPLADDDALKQYRDTTFNMLLASPLGAGFGVHQRAQARDTVVQDDALKQRQADAQNRQLAKQEAEQKAAAEAQAEADRKADPAYAEQFLQDYEARLAEFQGINTKKLGKDATFEEREILNENKAKKAELGAQLSADTQEYRQLKGLHEAAQNAPAQAEMFPETRGGQTPGAQQVAQDEQQRALYGQQSAIQVPAAPAGMTSQPALPETVPDYLQQARALKTQIEPLQTQMQQTSDLNRKLALGKQLTDINSAIVEAEKAAKKQGKSPQDQIKALAYQMSAAEINGDHEAQITIAQKLLALGVTDLSKLPQAFDLKATKKQFSETQAEFDTRAGEAIASGREGNRAQQNKITAEAAKLGKIGENYQPTGEEYSRDARQERQTQNEILKMEDQAAMNKGQTAQYTLFGEDTGSRPQVRTDAQGNVKELPGKDLTFGTPLTSSQRSGTGALSTNTRARLQAALQIAQATGNRQAVSDAVAALKDLKAREEAQAGAGDQTYNFAELEKASGQKMPANVAAQQNAADARDTAYANVVDLVSKYNQGKAKKEALDRARDFLIENLAKDIETSRGKPLTTAEQLQVQDQANKLLDELIGRFGDTRNVSSVGTGYFTAESKGPGYRTFANPYAAAMSIQEGLDNIRNKGVEGRLGSTTVEAKTTPTETTPAMVMDQLHRVLNADITDADRQTAIQIADNLKALANNKESLALASDWLYQLNTGKAQPTTGAGTGNRRTYTPAEQSALTKDVKALLATAELGKRSETEGGKTAIQEELPGVEAAGTVFGSQKEFDDYLASDALVQIRKDQGLVTQTVSRLKAVAAPFAKKAEGLRVQLASLQAKYAAAQQVSADEVDLAKAMSAEAKANLKAVIDRLDAELWQHQEAYIQASITFGFSVKTAEELSANIEANARDYTEPQRKALSDYRKAKRALAKEVAKDPQSLVWPSATFKERDDWVNATFGQHQINVIKAQAEVVHATQTYRMAMARSQTQQSVVKFLDTDLNLQMQLQGELAEMDRAGESLLNAGVALELAKQKQDRSHKSKKSLQLATSDISAAMQIEQEALAAAQGKQNLELAQINATATELAAAEAEANKADTLIERQRKQRERDQETLYAENIYDREKRDREERRLDNESRARLEGIPGQRLDFSKRREMLNVVDSSRDAEDQITFNIEDSNRALDQINKNIELQQTAIDNVQVIIGVLKPKKRLGTKQTVDLEHAERKLQDATAALEKSKQSKQVFERAIARSESALTRLNKRVEEISKAFSNDAEVQKKIKASATRRIASRENQLDTLSQKLNNIRDDEANRPERTKIRHEIAKKKREIRDIRGQIEGERGLTRTVLHMPQATVDRLQTIADNTALPETVRNAAEAKLNLQADLDEEASLTPVAKPTKEDESQEAVAARKALGKRKLGPVVKDVYTGKTSQAGTVKGLTGNQALKQTIKGDALRQAFARIEYLDDLYERTQAALDRATDPEKIAKFKSNLSTIEADRNKAEAHTDGFTPIGVGTDATQATSSVQTLLNNEGKDALADGRTLDVLRNIIATTDVPFIRENAEKLLAFVSRTRIMYSPDITVNGEAVPAAYNAQENAVGVRPGFESESNVVHELTHAATMRALEGPEEKLNADQLAAKREITGIYNRLTADGTLKGQYAAKNVKEFVSEVQSNADLRKKLGSVKMFGSTALRKIFDAIMRFVGMNPSYVKTEEAQAVIERLYMQSGKLEGVADSANIFAPTKPKYGSENALTEFAKKTVSQPKGLKERLGKNIALEAEMEIADMRAAAREVLNIGSKSFNNDQQFTQAMASILKADQYMPMVSASLESGPPEIYEDAKGLRQVQSSGKDTAIDVFKAVENVPAGNSEGKFGLSSAYMIAQRATNKGLTKLDLGNLGVKEGDLEAAMDAANADPKMKDALESVREKYNSYNAGLIKFLASTGKITKATAEKWLQEGDYVPYYRVRDDGTAELVFGGEKTITIGDIRHQPYLAELVGGETKILPLNESIMRNTMLIVKSGMSNLAAKEMGYAMQMLGKGAGPIDAKTGLATNKMAIKKGKNPGGPNIIVFDQEPDPKDSKDDGQRYVRVETEGTVAEGIPTALLVRSLEGAHLTLPAFLKIGGIAGDLLRKGITRMPPYILRQLYRDPMAASFTAGLNYGPFTAVVKAGKEFIASSRGESKTNAELIKKGLVQSGIYTGDPDDVSAFALQLASGKGQGTVDSFLAMLDRAAIRADSATRSLVYDNALANGLSEVEADMMVMESMNFYKRGLSPTVQYANRLIPFMNAQIQGLNVLYKAATGKMPFNEQQQIKRKFYNNALVLFATGFAYAMAMDDDETFKNAKPRDKYSNFFVNLPGVDEPLKIAIPYEAGWFFSAAVAAVDAVKAETDNKQQFEAIRDMFLGAVPGYSSKFVPQAVKPLFEVFFNKSFFSGNNIESMGMQGKTADQRYNTSTTEGAKMLANVLPGLSPIQVDYLAKAYLGAAPILALQAAGSLFEKEGAVEKPEARLSQNPVFGSMFQRTHGGADADVVFKLANEAKQAKSSFDSLKKSGDLGEMQEFGETHREELAAAPAAARFISNMGKLRTQEELITNRANLTAAEKRTRIDGLDEARQTISKQYMQAIKKIESQF